MNKIPRSSPRLKWMGLWLALIVALAAAGCRATPTPPPTPTATLRAVPPGPLPPPATQTRIVVLTATGEAAQTPTGPGATTTAAAEKTLAPSPTGAPGKTGEPAAAEAGQPSPTACQLPPGWVLYTIQSGDTLSGLAEVTGSTVEEIMRANCKEDDRLIAFDSLFLPRRPPIRAALPPVVLRPPEDPCASIFSCADPSLPSLSLPIGGPAAGTLVPCDPGRKEGRTDQWIDSQFRRLKEVAVGVPQYFFACGFSQEGTFTAWVAGQEGREDLQVEGIDALPPGSIQDGISPDQKVVVWYPICRLKPGIKYTLYISNGTQNASITVDLVTLLGPKIMTRPRVAKPGGTIEIFYCGYTRKAESTVQIELYQNTGEKQGELWVYDHMRSWDITINRDGWFSQVQVVAPDTPANTYALEDTGSDLTGEVYLWIVR